MSKPTEKTALVGGAEEKTAQEKFHTAGSILVLIVVAVTKTQLTAFLFSYSHVPTAYSLYSCVVTSLLIVPFFLAGLSPFQYPTMKMARVFTLIVVFTSLDLAFTNIALSEVSTALQQCIASSNAFWCIMIETALTRKWQHPVVYLTVSLVVLGAVLASLGSVTKISAYGVIAAVVAVLASACKYVFTHSAFREFKGEMGALSLLFWVDLLIAPIYLAWTLINGELQTFFEEDLAHDGPLFWQVTGTAALGGVRALTQYLVLNFVTATSLGTANLVQQSLNIFISIPIQHIQVTPYLASGIVVVLIFSGFYTYIKSNKPFLAWIDEKLGWTPDNTGVSAQDQGQRVFGLGAA